MLLLVPSSSLALERDPDEAITFPALVFVEGRAGERITRDVVVQNQTLVDVDLAVGVVDMQEGRGNSRALDYVPSGTARRGAGAWVQAPDPAEFGIAAASQHVVKLVVDIPAEAGPGGYYAALMFTAEDPRPEGQIPIDVRHPVPVFVTVRGAYERELRVSVDPDQRWRWRGGRATWTLELHNAGDVHEVFAGRVRVDGLLSGARSSAIRPGILLPGERRTQRVSFDLRDAPDLIGAQLRIERDEGRPVQADATRVVVLPWWLLVLVAVATIVVTWRVRTRPRAAADWGEEAGAEVPWDPSPPAG